MIFSEIYGSYFNAIAAVLEEAVNGTLTDKSLSDAVIRHAFGESLLTIPAQLKSGTWPLITPDLKTPIRTAPTMPLSLLQKRWMKALLSDPRIKLFDPDISGLEDIDPLFSPDDYVYFDRYTDGDPFEDAEYIEHFRTMLSAIKQRKKVRVRFKGPTGIRHSFICIPQKLEYSAKDDKFRMLCEKRGQMVTVNFGRIRSVSILDEYSEEELRPANYRERSLVMELVDERNALERVMLHFSNLEKETERIDDKHYRITLWYKYEDETEILIRVLSFGPVLKVISPEGFKQQMKARIGKQMKLSSAAAAEK